MFGHDRTPTRNEALQRRLHAAGRAIWHHQRHRRRAASDRPIIVWGTVGEDAEKRSFECDYGTKITGFKLREIHPQQ
jgi:hypothetical protein